jgi:hypothetical protein
VEEPGLLDLLAFEGAIEGGISVVGEEEAWDCIEPMGELFMIVLLVFKGSGWRRGEEN